MKTHGFTFVELIMMMILLGVLAVVAMPRFIDRLTFDELAFFDQTKSMLRYAQKLAVAQNRKVYVRLNGSSIALCYDAACGSSKRVAPESGNGSGATACAGDINWFCEAPPNGVSYTSGNALFYFSAQGKPYNSGDTEPTSSFTGQLSITITSSGSSRTIYVEQETGYVHS